MLRSSLMRPTGLTDMFKSAFIAVVVVTSATALAHAQTDQQKQQNTHNNVQTGIANTPRPADPPKVSTGTVHIPSGIYTNTNTHPSPVQSGGGSSTIHNYNRPPPSSINTLPHSSPSSDVPKSTTTTTAKSTSTTTAK